MWVIAGSVLSGILIGILIVFIADPANRIHRHTWTRWKDYRIYGKEGETIVYVERRQSRECERCGKREDKQVSIY
jgi:hypothetical protein